MVFIPAMHGVILLAVVVVVLVVCGWLNQAEKKRCLSCALYSYTIFSCHPLIYNYVVKSPAAATTEFLDENILIKTQEVHGIRYSQVIITY